MEERKVVRRAPIEENAEPIKQDTLVVNNTSTSSKGIEVMSEEEEMKLLKFVSQQIEAMNHKILFDGKHEPSFFELDMALSTYEQTMFGLIAIYESAKYDAEIAKAKYDEFYAEKYMETRNSYNTLDTKKSTWLSATEIDATTRTRYKTELAELKSESIRKDCEKSTLERMLKSWESYQFILSQLSKNSIAEAQINGLVKYDLKRGDELDC